MRKLILLSVIGLSILNGLAQDCKDVVFPLLSDSTISNCCIIEVKYGNIVHYVKNNKRHITEASRIVKDGQSFGLQAYTPGPVFNDMKETNKKLGSKTELYKGFNYNYYQKKYRGASIQIGIGIFLTFTGATANITSIFFANDSKNSNDATGTALNVYGILAFNTGLPLWISGGIKRGNNRRAMRRTHSTAFSPKSLQLGTTCNGFGLVLNL